MPGKVFVNYRRDDERSTAARIRDRLAATFGDANVFMDVDNLLAGQRFDKELEKALNETDVFLAVIERTPLPRADALPEDIRDLALHQTHEVAHARFGRDVADLIEAIRATRKAARPEAVRSGTSTRWVGAVALTALVFGGAVLAYQEAERQWRAKVVADSQRFKVPEITPEEEARRLQEAASKRAEAAKHPAVAQLRQGMSYAKARPILLGGGWQPFKQPRDHVCGSRKEICDLYVETVSCAGTGLAPCRFEWMEASGKKLVVITSGESDQAEETFVAHWYLE